MEKSNYRVWMVRAGQGGYLLDDFLDNGIVAIGWNEISNLTSDISYENLKQKFRNAYPEAKDGKVNQCVGQIWRFLKEFKIGDNVVTYDSSSRQYFLGKVESDYKFNDQQEYHHYRNVSWDELGTERDALSADAKNTLGAISTIFEISSEVWKELNENNPAYISEDELKEMEEAEKHFEEEDLRALKEDVIFRSLEFIKDIISNLTWQDTELLVAGLLRGMGYRTRMTSRGGDLGSDILASPDELALNEPRIRVEVKKRSKDKIGADEIRNFLGGMRGYHKGIYVTTSGFTKEAVYEAERANFAITLIDSNWLVELIVSNYDSLDPEIKAIVPLKKIYWPV